MKASETSLRPVIEGTKQYVVPLFQRTYTWDTREWDMLWRDVEEVSTTEDGRAHFIGSIVTMPTQSVPQGVAKYLLIDGQQRLTTVYILLAAIRDAARGQPGTLAAGIDDLLLTNRYETGNDALKLLPTQGDRQAFMEIMANAAEIQPGQIAKSYRFFERKLRGWPVGQLEAIRNAITERLTLVSITLDREDNPYLIFESLNAKGRPLSQSDLIRNYFFMRLPQDRQDTLYQSLWTPMEDALGADLTEYIRHFLMKDGVVVKQGDVYTVLKSNADQKKEPEEVIDYLKSLTRFASYYSMLLRPDSTSTEGIPQRLRRLNRIEVTTAYPLLLNFLDRRAEGSLADDEFAEILDVIENFLIRRFVCGVPTNPLNKIFPAVLVQAATFDSLVTGVKTSLRTRGYPKDAEFRDRLVSSNLYGGGDRIQKTKIILERLEASFANKEVVPFDSLTIEHVMPQTLTDWWREHLGQHWEVTHELLLNTLGNLTITAYNSPLSNRDMDDKRAIFATSHLDLNRYFTACVRWDEEAIRRRADSLAERALTIWPSFGPEANDAEGATSGVTGRTPIAVHILGQRFSVGTWRDVAQRTLEAIADLDEDRLVALTRQYPRFVGWDPSKFRSSRSLRNGLFMEVNLSAAAIHQFCVQATEGAEWSADEWRVDLADD